MIEHAGFLADILEHPADDAPRLIYADWLEDNGEEGARAEFIRVQCELADKEDEFRAYEWPDYLSPMVRLDALRRRELEVWCGGLSVKFRKALGLCVALVPEDACDEPSHGFPRRGFIAEVHCPLQSWLDHGLGIVARHPVEVVRATDREPSTGIERGQFSWTWTSDRDRWHAGTQSCLPRKIRDMASDSYPTDDAAHAALSLALLAYARERRPKV